MIVEFSIRAAAPVVDDAETARASEPTGRVADDFLEAAAAVRDALGAAFRAIDINAECWGLAFDLDVDDFDLATRVGEARALELIAAAGLPLWPVRSSRCAGPASVEALGGGRTRTSRRMSVSTRTWSEGSVEPGPAS